MTLEALLDISADVRSACKKHLLQSQRKSEREPVSLLNWLLFNNINITNPASMEHLSCCEDDGTGRGRTKIVAAGSFAVSVDWTAVDRRNFHPSLDLLLFLCG